MDAKKPCLQHVPGKPMGSENGTLRPIVRLNMGIQSINASLQEMGR